MFNFIRKGGNNFSCDSLIIPLEVFSLLRKDILSSLIHHCFSFFLSCPVLSCPLPFILCCIIDCFFHLLWTTSLSIFISPPLQFMYLSLHVLSIYLYIYHPSSLLSLSLSLSLSLFLSLSLSLFLSLSVSLHLSRIVSSSLSLSLPFFPLPSYSMFLVES